MHSIKHKTI